MLIDVVGGKIEVMGGKIEAMGGIAASLVVWRNVTFGKRQSFTMLHHRSWSRLSQLLRACA